MALALARLVILGASAFVLFAALAPDRSTADTLGKTIFFATLILALALAVVIVLQRERCRHRLERGGEW